MPAGPEGNGTGETSQMPVPSGQGGGETQPPQPPTAAAAKGTEGVDSLSLPGGVPEAVNGLGDMGMGMPSMSGMYGSLSNLHPIGGLEGLGSGLSTPGGGTPPLFSQMPGPPAPPVPPAGPDDPMGAMFGFNSAPTSLSNSPSGPSSHPSSASGSQLDLAGIDARDGLDGLDGLNASLPSSEHPTPLGPTPIPSIPSMHPPSVLPCPSVPGDTAMVSKAHDTAPSHGWPDMYNPSRPQPMGME
ncbi:hypothetical protein KIPB_007479, partial [Kipferlia bialata]|eukprot:g7479.t1